MAQHALQAGHFAPAFAARNRNVAVVSTRRMPRSIRAAAGKHEEHTPLEPGAAFLLSLGSLLATAQAANAEGEAVPAVPAVPDLPISPETVVPVTADTTPVPPEAVDTAVSSVVDAVKAAGGAVKTGISIAGKGAEYVKEAADVATPYVKKGIDAATPYVKATADVVTDVAKPVIKAAAPVVQAGVGEVEDFLSKQGLNAKAIVEGTKGVTSKAEEAINLASPAVKSTAGNISATSPEILGKYALGLIAFYYLGPPVLKAVFGSLRGYAGQISPAAALDAASNEGNAVILDIRTAYDKELAGIPDLPNGNRLIELEYVSVTDRKVRNQLRNVGEIERKMTVLQIASLKKVKKSSKILLLDKNGGQSKDIAKELAARGYKRVFVIAGGFSGWTANKLQTKGSSSVSAVEVLGPVFGTRGTKGTRGTRGTRGSTSTRSDRPVVKPTRYLPTGR